MLVNAFIAAIPVGSSSAGEDQASSRQVVTIVSTSSTETLTFTFHGTAMVVSLQFYIHEIDSNLETCPNDDSGAELAPAE